MVLDKVVFKEKRYSYIEFMKILKDAMINPEKYNNLTVRLYGFSEYFTNLPEWQQKAVLSRTEYVE